MKNLVVCFDGTWNMPEQEENGVAAPTNVVKLYNSLADKSADGDTQLKYYHPGVGTEHDNLKKQMGGMFGYGIAMHIKSAYFWLGKNFQKDEDDRIYLFGFSRGAFTVQSLSALINYKGIPDLRRKDSKSSWEIVDSIYDEYKDRDFSEPAPSSGVPIHFLGLWDMVGALGIPDTKAILNLFDTGNNWKYHDGNLQNNVKYARHAMAVDEWRASFTVSRWNNADECKMAGIDVKELWFSGVHSDVGGGYYDSALSDCALEWMIQEGEKCNLGIRAEAKEFINPDPCGAMHNSLKGIFKKLRSRPRNIPAVVRSNKEEFYSGVFERQNKSPISYPPYHTTVILQPGDEKTVEIFADKRWNYTGIYLEQGGEYYFSAEGEWVDLHDSCDWKGTDDGRLTIADITKSASSFLGSIEKLFHSVSGNNQSDFYLTKRIEDFPWFILVGAVCNDSGSVDSVANDGSPVPHFYFKMPDYEQNSLIIDTPGYLYCFPNDVWSLYENNHGSIQLTVKRKND